MNEKEGQSRKCVLVTGASGAIGPRVVDALLDAGYTVRTFSLDESTKHGGDKRVDVHVGDVTDAPAIASAIKGIYAVVHLAALLHEDESKFEYERYDWINVQGTRNVVSQALAAGVRRLIFASTISVYGSRAGSRVVDEGAKASPVTMYGLSKYQAEQIVLQAKDKAGNWLGTVLRFGSVYGTGVKGNYRRLLEAIMLHRFIPLGKGENRRSLIYDKDLARVVVLALENTNAAGDLFNVTDGRLYTMKEILRAMYFALDRKMPRYYIPVFCVRLLLSGGLILTRILGLKLPLRPGMLDKYTEDIAISGEKCRRLLRFKPRYSLQTGWREILGQKHPC